MPKFLALFVLSISLGYAGEEDAVRSITAALRARHFDEALKLAQAARKESPKSPRILILEGMAFSGLGKDADALADFNSALELSPDSVPALEGAAEIEYRLVRPTATAHLERLLELRPGEPTAHAMLGALAWKRHDCAAAVRHFSSSKPVIASQPDALREFGVCLIQLQRPQEAVEIFQQLASANRDDRHARYALAISLMDCGRFPEALDALKDLVAANDPTALELASSAHEAQGETPEAVALLRQAILLDPHNVKLYLDFASLSFTHQSFQVGIDMVNAGLTQLPDSAPLYLARGVLYVQLGLFEKADVDFDRAEKLDPKQALGSVVRGLSQIQQNNIDEALATVRSQLEKNPKDEFLHYVLAEVLTRQGTQPDTPEFREALNAALEAVRLKPDFVLAHDVLSRLYLESRQIDRAIEQCRLALKYDPDDEMALYRLMRALQASGRKEAAAELPELLKRFNAAREKAQKQEEQAGKYRLVESSPDPAAEPGPRKYK